MPGRTTPTPMQQSSRLNPNAPVFIPMAPQTFAEFSDELWRKIYLESFSHVFPEGHRIREELRALKLLHRMKEMKEMREMKENQLNDGWCWGNGSSGRNGKMVDLGSGAGVVKPGALQEEKHEYDYDRVLPDGDFLFHGFEPEEEEEKYWNERNNAWSSELRRDAISLSS